MKNLSISKKLLVSFGIIVVLMVFIIIFSIISMTRVGGNLDEFHDVPFENVQSVVTMDKLVQQSARDLLIAMVENDYDSSASRLESAYNTMDEALAELEFLKQNCIYDPEKLAEIESYTNSIKQIYQDISTSILENNAEAAYEVFETEVVPTFTTLNQLVAGLEEFIENRAVQIYDEAHRSINTTTIVSIAMGVAAVVIAVLFATYISKMLTIGIQEVNRAAAAMARGDFTHVVKYESKDEVGEMADSIREMSRILGSVIDDIEHVLNEVANGNLRVKSKDETLYVGGLNSIINGMKGFITKFNMTLAKINNASDQVAAGSDQVSSGAQALSQGATEQASSVEELAATINEISGKINTNANDSADASNKTNDAGTEMQAASDKMKELVAAMNEISNSSSETQKIIKTIEDIAFQTNILALNAAVEAARAGAAGKGFAVVADEVRNLAGKSAEAAKNTTNLIEATVSAISKGNGLVDEVATMMDEVTEATMAVAKINQQISGASKDAADSISQITVGINQISGVVQTNSATSEESAAASEELSGQARMLKELVGEFKLSATSR
ncbi:MAG: methyl-accepting chemotaxis protein [Ruminococcus sp.]|nr:methyl-accepting chemotaxis protein [Ruminococcus sp.]